MYEGMTILQILEDALFNGFVFCNEKNCNIDDYIQREFYTEIENWDKPIFTYEECDNAGILYRLVHKLDDNNQLLGLHK